MNNKTYILRSHDHKGIYVYDVLLDKKSPTLCKGTKVCDWTDTENIDLALRFTKQRATAMAVLLKEETGKIYEVVKV